MKLLMITVLALTAVVSADPAVILSGGLVSSPLTSAALVAPATAPVVSPVAPVSQVASYSPFASYSPLASYSAVSPVGQIAPLSPLTQVLSDYKYAFGPSYSYQDYYPLVNSGLSLPYTVPSAYAADWYYRK